jgi:DNA replication protein DnaC
MRLRLCLPLRFDELVDQRRGCRRAIELRMKEAHLPRIKTLEEFDFAQSPHIPAARIRALAEGGYLERAEPVLLVGDPGTGVVS